MITKRKQTALFGLIVPALVGVMLASGLRPVLAQEEQTNEEQAETLRRLREERRKRVEEARRAREAAAVEAVREAEAKAAELDLGGATPGTETTPTTRPADPRPGNLQPLNQGDPGTGQPTATTQPADENGVRTDADELPDISQDELERSKERAMASTQPASGDPLSTTATAEPTDTPGVNVNPATGQMTIQPKTFWNIPHDERPYFFTWKNTPVEKACEDFVELSGLSLIGLDLVNDGDRKRPLSFQSVKLMNFDEALTQFNMLLADVGLGFWILQKDQYLEIHSLTDWYRRLDPERMYRSEAEYRAAKLPEWEFVTTFYNPQHQSSPYLAQFANDRVPDNTARATVDSSTNHVQIQGVVPYVERQYAYMKGADVEDPRVWIEYELRHVTPTDAAMLLDHMLKLASSSPTPAPAQGRGRGEGDVGISVAEAVDIQQRENSKSLLIYASPEKHQIIAEHLKERIDIEGPTMQKTERFQLKHIDPNRAVQILSKMVGTLQVIQRPAPKARPDQPQPPAPPPQILRIKGAEFEAIPEQKVLIVSADDNEMKQIRELLEMIDVPEEVSKYRFVEMKHVEASSVVGVLTTVLSRRAGRGTEQFRAVVDASTDKSLIMSGPLEDLNEAEQLIEKLDVDPMRNTSEHLIALENAEPSTVAMVLNQKYTGSSGGSRYSSYGRRGGGATGMPQFIPEDGSRLLIVICQDDDWDDINALIKQLDERAEVLTTTRSYRLEHAELTTVVNVINDTFGGGRYSYYRGSALEAKKQPKVTGDMEGNRIFITATEEVHEKTEALIKEMDQPNATHDYRSIELVKADAEYVKEKILELFGQQSSSSRYGYWGRSSGADQKVRVISEPISNRVLVAASDADFEKAKTLAMEIDEQYIAQNYVRKLFTLEYAEPWDVQSVVSAIYEDVSGGSSRYRSTPATSTPGGVKMAAAGNGIIVLAPEDKMKEIESLIAEIDKDPSTENEIRMYRVDNVDYYGTSRIASSLQQLFGSTTVGRRGTSNTPVKFIGEYGSDILFVSAPSEKMQEIDQQVQEYLKNRVATDLTTVIQHFKVNAAKPQQVADMIQPILEAKNQELQQQAGSRGRYGYGSQGVQLTVNRAKSEIMVMAPQQLMELTGELISNFDERGLSSTTQFMELERARAIEIAPIVEQQINESGSSAGRSPYYRGYRGYNYTPRSSGSGEEELTVTPVEANNMIILRGPEDKVFEAMQLIKVLDQNVRPKNLFKVFKIEHADLYDVSDMIYDAVGGATDAYGNSTGPVKVRTDYSNAQLIVMAPPEELPTVEEVVRLCEELARPPDEPDIAIAEGGPGGEVLSRDGKNIRKLYEVKGPAKEIAEELDRTLYALIGYDAPIVKPFLFGNQIVISGEAKHFKQAEEWLEKIEKNPPRPKVHVRVYRVPVSPSKVVQQVQRMGSAGLDAPPVIKEMTTKGIKRNPLDLIEEIDAYQSTEPQADTTRVSNGSASPCVLPMMLDELQQATAAMSWAQNAEVTTQPATTPEVPTTAPAGSVTVADTPDEEPSTSAAPETAGEAADAAPEAVAETTPGEGGALGGGTGTASPSTRFQDPAVAEIYQAADEVLRSRQTQILYDEDEGVIVVVGPEAQTDEVGGLVELIVKELEKIEDVTKADIRVWRVRNIDVTLAASILEEMFNEGRAQRGRQEPRPQPRETKPKEGEGEAGESDAAKRRREAEAEAAAKEEAAAQAAAATQIKVIPDPRTSTLIIKAAPDLFPEIAELLLKIDHRGTDRMTRIKIFQLKTLNAGEVEQVIKDVLKIEDRSQLARARLPRTGRGGDAAAQAAMLEQLEAQMLRMQLRAAQAGGAEGAEGEEGEGGAGVQINPAQDLSITSDATTNSIIVMGPEQGIELVESLINDLEKQPIPILIETIKLANASAAEVVTQLEKVFEGGRRSGGRGEGDVGGQRMGDVRIAADERTNKITIRALEPDMQKILPLVHELDRDALEDEMEIYTVTNMSATEVVNTLTDMFAKGDGADRVRMTANAETNTIIVRAPEARQKVISYYIDELDKKGGQEFEPRTIQLKVATATNVADKLQSIFVGRGPRARMMGQRISITGDDSSKMLFVQCPPEMFETIKKTADMLDQTTEHSIRVFELKHAAASDILDMFKQMTLQLMGPLGGSMDPMAATIDERTNSLIVAGTPRTFLAVETVLAQLDQPPPDSTKEVTKMFTLLRGNASQLVGTIRSLYGDTKWYGGVPAPKVAAEPSANVLYVTGTQAQIDQIETTVIKPLEQLGPSDTTVPMVDYVVKTEYADVVDISAKLTSLFAQWQASRRNAGVTLTPAQSALAVVPDPATSQLFISCAEETKAKIDEWLQQMDVEAATTQGQQTAVIPIKYANLAYVHNALATTFRKSGRVPPSEEVTFAPEYGTNTIIVKAPERDMRAITELIAKIDDEGLGPKPVAPERIPVQHVRATQLASRLDQMIRQNYRPDTRTRQYPITVSGDDTASALLVTAQSQQHMEQVKELIAQLDTPPAEDPRDIKPYVLKFADLASTRNIILKRFSNNDELPLRDQVAVEYDYSTGALVVTASEENQNKVAKIIEDVDDPKIIDPRVPETVEVRNVRASDLARTLTEMIRISRRPDLRTRTYPITVTADDTANTLLITANAADMEEMRDLVAKLDIPPEEDPRTVKAYVLKYADLASTRNIIMKRYSGMERRPLKDQVAVEYDYSTGALVVTASEQNQAKVTEIIADIDSDKIVEIKLPKTIKVHNVRASDLAKTLDEMIRSTRKIDQRTRKYPVTVQANDAGNTLLVTANKEDMEQMEKLIVELDKPIDIEDERQIETYTLEFVDASSVVNIINTRFASHKALAMREQVDALVEGSTNSVVVTATTENHVKVAELIKQLDSSDIDKRQSYTFTLGYISPDDLSRALTTVYNTARPRSRSGRVPAVFTPVTGTDKLLVTCTPTELLEVEALVKQLDVLDGGGEDRRAMEVVTLKNVAPREMVLILSDYMRKPGTARGALLDDVQITASDSTSAVVITGPEERLLELRNLAERVDATTGDAGGRVVEVFPLINADPSSVASMISHSFTKRSTSEVDRVDASADRGTNSIVVRAKPETLAEIRLMIEQLDNESTNAPRQEIIRLVNARAEDIVTVLQQTYSRGARGANGPPISFAADSNGNALVISAGVADLEGIRTMVAELDAPVTDPTEQLRIIPLQHIDAAETLVILTEYLRKPSGARSRGGTGDLIGDIRLQSSPTLNALIVSGSEDEINRVQDVALQMDKDMVGAGAPRVIEVKNVMAAQIAPTLTKIFTDPAMRTKGRTNPDAVPLILADEATNSLVIRARSNDFGLIEEMVQKLDKKDTELSGFKVIQVDRSVNVVELARQIEQTINNGERAKRTAQQGYIPREVAIGAEPRTNALLVTGPSDMFPMVESLVTQLKDLKPPSGSMRAIAVPVKNLSPRDVERVLEQFIDQQHGTSRRR